MQELADIMVDFALRYCLITSRCDARRVFCFRHGPRRPRPGEAVPATGLLLEKHPCCQASSRQGAAFLPALLSSPTRRAIEQETTGRREGGKIFGVGKQPTSERAGQLPALPRGHFLFGLPEREMRSPFPLALPAFLFARSSHPPCESRSSGLAERRHVSFCDSGCDVAAKPGQRAGWSAFCTGSERRGQSCKTNTSKPTS
jgi:hypothetical protein